MTSVSLIVNLLDFYATDLDLFYLFSQKNKTFNPANNDTIY